MKPDSPLIIRTFAGLEVRETPQAQMVAVDVLKAIGQKNPNAAWSNIKKQYPEILQESCKYSKGKGRPVDVVTLRGAIKLAMLAKGPRAAEFRTWAAKLIEGYETADEALTTDLIDRTDDEAALQRIELRARTKRTNKVVNRAIAEADANCYSQMADMRNVAVCGRTAKEIKRLRGVTQTRDGMTDAELTLIAASEELEASAIKLRKARGNGEVLTVGMNVTTDVAELRRRYLGPLSLPAGNAEAVPVLQVEI